MDLLERNKIVEQHQNMAWWTIHHNRRLITALNLEDQDVFQELMIVMMKAVDRYDPERGRLEPYLFQQLQYGILSIKRKLKPYGITQHSGCRIEVQSTDYIPEDGMRFDIPVEDDVSDLELADALGALTEDELEVVCLKIDGYYLRKKAQKDCIASAREKLTKIFSEWGDEPVLQMSTAIA